MKPIKSTILVAIVMCLMAIASVVFAQPQNVAVKVKWERIVGIISPGGIVGGGRCDGGEDCAVGTPIPWTVNKGTARVNLTNGRVYFKVEGLVVADDPSFANIGTPSVITMVKSTLVCNDTPNDTTDVADLVDTDAVPLSVKGDAYFAGPSCHFNGSSFS